MEMLLVTRVRDLLALPLFFSFFLFFLHSRREQLSGLPHLLFRHFEVQVFDTKTNH
jgi:hypothetical protein